MKTIGYFVLSVSLVFVLQGCSNTWAGLRQTGHGVVADVKGLTGPKGALKKTDDWVRENMW